MRNIYTEHQYALCDDGISNATRIDSENVVFVVEKDVELQGDYTGSRLLDVDRNGHLDAERRFVCVDIFVLHGKPDFEPRKDVFERVLVAVRHGQPFEVNAADSREILVHRGEDAVVLLECHEQFLYAGAIKLIRICDVLPAIRRKEDLAIRGQFSAIPRSGLIQTSKV